MIAYSDIKYCLLDPVLGSILIELHGILVRHLSQIIQPNDMIGRQGQVSRRSHEYVINYINLAPIVVFDRFHH
jgi:hypothetical protein